MTLVAAYRAAGVPTLVGDCLLTGSDTPSRLCKKIHRVQPNFVVGWTGSQLSAERVLTSLRGRCGNESLTREQLERFLTSFPHDADLDRRPVTLVGWIVDGEPHCFLWRSDWSHEIYYEDHHFVGSGAELFEQVAGAGSGPEEGPPWLERVLTSACYLMADEIHARENRAAGFGHAYEVVSFNGSEFLYLDELAFLFVDVPFASVRKVMPLRLHPIVYKSHHVADHTVVETFNAARNELVRDLIPPAYRVPPSDTKAILRTIVSPQYRPFSLGTCYSCLFARLIGDADTAAPRALFPLIVLAKPDDAPALFSAKWDPSRGSLTVKFLAQTEEMFEKVYRDQVPVKGE